jgi:ABC-type dipeptide/oligopeptide/nickel transport system permease subunit
MISHIVAACGGAGGCIGACLIVLLVADATGAPWIAPLDPSGVDMLSTLQPPDATHWFGTDQSDRDVLSRVIWGGRASLEVAHSPSSSAVAAVSLSG